MQAQEGVRIGAAAPEPVARRLNLMERATAVELHFEGGGAAAGQQPAHRHHRMLLDVIPLQRVRECAGVGAVAQLGLPHGIERSVRPAQPRTSGIAVERRDLGGARGAQPVTADQEVVAVGVIE